MERFDCPDVSMITAKRNTTITAIQALALLNNPFILKQAQHLAERVQAAETTPRKQVDTAVRFTLQRKPDAREAEALTSYLTKYGVVNLCRLLINTNEFLFVD
jgi:hypothetical protein